jgi:hypothetical protein
MLAELKFKLKSSIVFRQRKAACESSPFRSLLGLIFIPASCHAPAKNGSLIKTPRFNVAHYPILLMFASLLRFDCRDLWSERGLSFLVLLLSAPRSAQAQGSLVYATISDVQIGDDSCDYSITLVNDNQNAHQG